MAAGCVEGMPPRPTTPVTQDAGAQFALIREKLVDFAYRAMHEMTVQSKTIVGAFYNRPPRLSYYQGCSTGGRQGMMEAQRYPDDFDAIIAGAPVYNMVHLNVSQTALQVHMLKNPERIVPQNKVTLVANAAVAACDAERRGQGQHHQRPARVQVRSRHAGVQGRRRRRLPDGGAGGVGAAAVFAGQDEVGRGRVSRTRRRVSNPAGRRVFRSPGSR